MAVHRNASNVTKMYVTKFQKEIWNMESVLHGWLMHLIGWH